MLEKIVIKDCGVALCLEKHCANKPEYSGDVTVNKMTLHIVLCKQHADEFGGVEEDIGF